MLRLPASMSRKRITLLNQSMWINDLSIMDTALLNTLISRKQLNHHEQIFHWVLAIDSVRGGVWGTPAHTWIKPRDRQKGEDGHGD